MRDRFKNIGFYFGVIGFLSFVMYWIIGLGKPLEAGRQVQSVAASLQKWSEVFTEVRTNFDHPLTLLLAQIILIILVARFFGFLCRKVHLPVVIGEIFAGIFLGPSLIGFYFPEFSATVFPALSLGNLNILSQIGLILFMFMVGMELDFNVLNKRAQSAVIISHSGIAFSFTLGILLAYFLYESFAPQGVRFQSFALFLGISVSITAFPVLARIMQEKEINKSRLGVFAITCAAVDDITAWSLLAVVITVVKAGSLISAATTIFLSIAYVVLMLKVVRPFLGRIGELHASRESLTKPVVAIFFLVLMASAFATEIIGIHAIFGGFMAGVIMPNNTRFRNIFIDKVEDVALVLFLPLFFVYTGLRTEIGLLNDIGLWKVCFLVILVAISGKMLGVTLASKFTGQSWRDSVTIGTLMNTRGLVELVVLNIGYDLGVLSPEIFAMLVIMALVTTLMTSPALDLVNWLFKTKKEEVFEKVAVAGKFKVLLSFANPERGQTLLRLAYSLLKSEEGKTSVTALHLTPADELFRYNVDEYEKESFLPVIEESQRLKLPITTLFKVSADIESDIVEVAQKGEYNLLLVGVGHSIFEGSFLGKVLGFTARIINPASIFRKVKREGIAHYSSSFDERIRVIINRCRIPVGIFIDKKLVGVNHVLVFLYDDKDLFLMRYIRRMTTTPGIRVSVMDTYGILKKDLDIRNEIRELVKQNPGQVQLLNNTAISKEFLGSHDLMVMSIGTWAGLVDMEPGWLFDIPSALILTS